MKYHSIFHEEKIMPFDYDDGGSATTFSEMVFNHDLETLWNCNDEKLFALYFERIEREKSVMN